MFLLLSRQALLVALAGLLPINAALGADPFRADGAESPFFEELPTVLSASRLPQVLNEAPGAVTILDRELIRSTGYRDVARLLRLVPGMQIGQERGHTQWVTYHGLGSDYPTEIQVLIDGRSVYAPSSFGGVDWSALPLTIQEIERIEVVRGTNSNAFGANAFLGVINIITRHSHQDRGASGQINVGNHGIADLQASWTGGSDGLGVRLSAAQTRDNGFSNLYDSRQSQTLSLRSDYRLDARDELTLRAGYNHIERGQGYPDSLFGNNAERNTGTDGSTIHLTWRRTIAEDEEWLLSLYQNHESGVDRWLASALPYYPYPAVPLDRSRASNRTNVEVQHRFALNPQARLVWGLESRRDKTEAPFLFVGGNPPAMNMYRAFSNLDWRLTPSWQLNLGGLLEKNGNVAVQFIPRAFVNWQASPSDTFRAGYARAWQQRNLFDLYGDVRAYDPARRGVLLAWPYQSNPNLRVPRVDTVEMGYLGRFHAIDATLDVRVFNERITDFVVRETVSADVGELHMPSSQFINASSPVVLRGIEYQLRSKPRPGTEFIFNHSLIDRHVDDPAIAKRTAPYTASLTWLQDYGQGWTSTASVMRMGPLAGGYGYVYGCDYTARAYSSLDLRIARSFRVDGRKAEIALNGINLGEPHQEITDRSEQCLPAHQGTPVNPASSMAWVSLAIEL
ncbi:TonB-dependent receptor [Zoogloea sp.]|uniref:TonB-dependent receptor plug domain-containing protein n=1 Tax=Zoogloea sp. TaxID=49181 RepID=UPI00258A0E51|nr:TonB-dependent receptor [Zoogloea sp.]MDD2667892.1 TonB-dependent receptor [Zoogloea sp.]